MPSLLEEVKINVFKVEIQDLRQGDLVIVEMTETVTQDMVANLMDRLNEAFAPATPVLLANGVLFKGIIRPES